MNRLLVLIRINALLRNAKRLIKSGQKERAKIFTDEAKKTIDRYVEAST